MNRRYLATSSQRQITRHNPATHAVMAHSNLSAYLRAIMKTFKISNEQVLTSAEALDAQVRDTTSKFPGLFSLKLSRIHKVLIKERETIVEHRTALLDQFTEYEGEGDNRKPVPVKNNDGDPVPNMVKLTDSKMFGEKEKELLKGEVEVSVPAISESELKDIQFTKALSDAILPFVEG